MSTETVVPTEYPLEDRFETKIIKAGRITIPKPQRERLRLVRGDNIQVTLFRGKDLGEDIATFRREIIGDGRISIPKPTIEKLDLKIGEEIIVIIRRETKYVPFTHEGKKVTPLLRCHVRWDGALKLSKTVAKRLLSGDRIESTHVIARFAFFEFDPQGHIIYNENGDAVIKTIDNGIQSFEIGIIEDK